MKELSDEVVKKICFCAQLRELRGDNMIFCEDEKGKDAPNSFEFMSIRPREICVATDFYSTGHSRYGSIVDINTMKDCPYRKN
jgi:hypothetical protein